MFYSWPSSNANTGNQLYPFLGMLQNNKPHKADRALKAVYAELDLSLT